MPDTEHPHQSPQSKGWTPERRAKQADAMRAWSPWTNSTGPRTRAGKARSARNSFKTGRYAAPKVLLRAILRNQRHLHGIAARNSKNELLKKGLTDMVLDGVVLLSLFFNPIIMQKT